MLCFGFYSKTETDVTNCVQMLHLRTWVCFTASLHSSATIKHVCTVLIIYLFIAFVTGAKELIATHYFCFCCWICKHVFVIKKKFNGGKGFWNSVVLCCTVGVYSTLVAALKPQSTWFFYDYCKYFGCCSPCLALFVFLCTEILFVFIFERHEKAGFGPECLKNIFSC